jgi:uncharacterized protein with HEPN domain
VRDEGLYLAHILECIGRVRRYTAQGHDAFFADEMAQDATLRNLQVLAESCRRLPAALRERRSDINWRAIFGFRNMIVHEYLHLSWPKIWEIISTDLDPLEVVVAEELAQVDAAASNQKGEGST